MTTLIRTVVPCLRENGTRWVSEERDYEYTNGMLSVLAPDSRVGAFDSLDDALDFLRRAMRAEIVETLTLNAGL